LWASADECEFANFLLKIGNGEYPSDDDGLVNLTAWLISDLDIVREIYGQPFFFETSDLVKCAILWHPRMSTVTKSKREFYIFFRLNRELLQNVNTLITEDESESLQSHFEFFNSLEMTGSPTHKLNLKESAVVMFLRNLYRRKGLPNGTRLIVRQMYSNNLNLEIITGRRVGQRGRKDGLVLNQKSSVKFFKQSKKIETLVL